MELGPEDVSSCISEGVIYRLQWSWDLKMCPHASQRVLYTGFNGVGT